MTKTESFEFKNLGDPGLSLVTLTKSNIGFILRLDEVGLYYVEIEISDDQAKDLVHSLEYAREETINLKEGVFEAQPKIIKFIVNDHEDPEKKGYINVNRSNKKIGLSITIEKNGDIEPYFSIETCDEIIALIHRVRNTKDCE